MLFDGGAIPFNLPHADAAATKKAMAPMARRYRRCRHASLGNYLPAICHAAAPGRSTPNERFVGTIRGSGECQTG
jgi:hypothetical protein